MRSCLLWVFYSGLILFCHQSGPGTRNIDIVKKAPSVAGDAYRCGEMVQVVNHLRQLGKDKSLVVLRDSLASGGNNDKVLLICRLLFVNPKGWKPPVLGEAVPAVNKNAAKQFPLFPIALSDRVPFLLVQGYRRGGRGESAAACLKLCEGLALVKEDYPLTGYEKAARALTQKDSFRQLYDKDDLPAVVKMVLHQAEVTPPRE